MSSFSKTLGSVLKWSGKWSFFIFIISLVLAGVVITLADPQSATTYVQTDGTNEYQFEVSDHKNVQILVSSHMGEDMDITLYKVEFMSGGETYNFRNSPSDTPVRTEILSANTDVFYDIRDLEAGVYIIQLTDTEGSDFTATILHSNFNLGQIVALVISLMIFGIICSVFFAVFPFWIFFSIIDATSGSRSSPPPVTQPRGATSSVPKSSPDMDNQHQSYRSNISQAAPVTSNIPDFIKGTQFEKLIKKDWAMLAAGAFFFIGYISDPFNGFLLFLSAGLFIIVAYNVTEREKSKQRIDILLRSYPKVSIAFVAEQLDKKEDYVIEVLRIMILDEGYPIRMDLITRSIIKLGKFTGERSSSDDRSLFYQEGMDKTSSEVSSSVEPDASTVSVTSSEGSDDKSSDKTSLGAQIRHGERGTVTEPWAYCQSCGEALKQKIKYCYICGARQHE